MIQSQRVVVCLLIVIFFYLLVLQPYAVWSFTVDDMYISLRYAKNWVNGIGLLWNANELPVEGYSNFSFVLIAALCLKLGINPVVSLKVVGWLGLCFSAFGIYRLSRLWLSRVLAIIPSIGLLLYRGEILWGISGLETTIYQALIIFSLVFLLRGLGYQDYPNPRKNIQQSCFLLSGLLLALASLTRPEGPFLMLLFFGIAWFDKPQGRQQDFLMGYSKGVLTFCLIYIPYFVWRWIYFGRLFPNPVYCKGMSESFFFLLDEAYLALAWPFLLLALPNFWQEKDKRTYYLLLPSLLYIILLIDADPVVAFSNRLFLPALSLLLPLAFLGLKQWVGFFISPKDAAHNFAVVLISLVVAFFFIPMSSLKGYQQFSVFPKKGEQLRQTVIDWLNKEVPSTSLVVLADCGMVPYSSNAKFIDSYCLNNKQMTEIVDTKMFIRFCNRIMITKPQTLILTSLHEKGKVYYAPADQCLKEALKKNNSYRFRTIFETGDPESNYRYEIYTALN